MGSLARPRDPAERWPQTWPALRDGRMKLSPAELDQLHDLWPEYWPPASALEAEEGGEG